MRTHQTPLIFAFLFLAACGSSVTMPIAKCYDCTGNVTPNQESFVSLHYYRGGFFPPPGAPNWSHDLRIDFETSGGARVNARLEDQLCFKTGALSPAEAAQVQDLLKVLASKKSTGPIMADGGVEWIELTSRNGSKTKYHLMDGEVPVGELILVNGAPLSTVLKDIDSRLAIGCQ